MSNIIFIGGTGRCGTNILRKILGQHPGIASLPFEYRFIIDPDGIVDFYNGYSTWSPYMADVKIKRLEKFLLSLSNKGSKKYNEWELDKHISGYSGMVCELINNLTDFTFNGTWYGSTSDTMRYSGPMPKNILAKILGDFIRKIVDSILDKTKCKIFVEDNTWNMLFAKELLELVPNAKIIHITRRYADVISSFMKQSWCPNDLKQATVYYENLIKRIFDIRDKIKYESLYEIEFEDLINEPRRMIEYICLFIDINFNEKMMDIDLSKHNIDRSKKELKQNDLDYIKKVLL